MSFVGFVVYFGVKARNFEEFSLAEICYGPIHSLRGRGLTVSVFYHSHSSSILTDTVYINKIINSQWSHERIPHGQKIQIQPRFFADRRSIYARNFWVY
eukprot:TRINITY_DN11748_c0_g1_i1.p2 TRINITY_DN11748_c0_g1~~TRINITY_DN11748_c0_g1_i1.p2  ORF type:complete len:99 (-),score=3.11 TRINITY_DN11748_c0_g1_i1:104-400(-)